MRRKTHEEFVKEVEILYGENSYKLLSDYINCRTKIKIKHIKCGHVWDSDPQNLLRGNKTGYICPNCNSNEKGSTSSFKKKVFELTDKEYLILGEYINSITPLNIKHNIDCCGYEYEVRPGDFIHKGYRCPKCSHKVKITLDDFKKIIYKLEKDDYDVIGEYVNTTIVTTMIHKKCGREFEIVPTRFIHENQRCPFCNNSRSIGENEIYKILTHNSINFIDEYTFEDCRNIGLLRYDFAILNDKNELLYLIEYDGKQHFKPVDFLGRGINFAKIEFGKITINDKIKNEYCRNNNIPLYRIPYWRFDEIESVLIKLIHNDHIEVDETSFLIL